MAEEMDQRNAMAASGFQLPSVSKEYSIESETGKPFQYQPLNTATSGLPPCQAIRFAYSSVAIPRLY